MATGTDGFECKACGEFFSNPEILKWDTKWETIRGEKALVQLIAECPRCGETNSYKIPEDVTMHFE
jgi:hypothetical protein